MTVLAAPPPATSRRQRLRAPLVTAAGLGAAALALHLRDPHVSGSWGYCPSAALGFWCPGCGGLRGVNDLTHGDVVAAASSNLLLVVLGPVVLLGLAVWTHDRWTGRSRSLPQPLVLAACAVVVVLTVAFTVLRNTPAGAWLAP